MMSAPRLSDEKEAHFKVLRNFKVSNLDWLLLEETFCNAGLNRLPESEFKTFIFFPYFVHSSCHPN